MFNFTEQSVLLNFLEGKHRESKETKRKTSNTNNNNSGGSNRQNKRHQTNDPRSGRGAGSTRRINGDCHNCGKPGHRAVDCRAPSGGAHRQGNQNQGSYALQHGGGNGRNGSNNGNNYGGGNYRGNNYQNNYGKNSNDRRNGGRGGQNRNQSYHLNNNGNQSFYQNDGPANRRKNQWNPPPGYTPNTQSCNDSSSGCN